MIYVDDMQLFATVGTLPAFWSHMFSDASVDELDEFAAYIGLKTSWRQDSHGFIHYDVTSGKRLQAVRLGATMIKYDDLPNYVHRLSPPGTPRRVTTFLVEGLSCPNPAVVV